MKYLLIISILLAGCGDSNDQDGAPIRPDPLPQVEHDVSIVRAELHPWDDDTARLFLILQNDGSQRLNFYITGVSADAYYDGVTIDLMDARTLGVRPEIGESQEYEYAKTHERLLINTEGLQRISVGITIKEMETGEEYPLLYSDMPMLISDA